MNFRCKHSLHIHFFSTRWCLPTLRLGWVISSIILFAIPAFSQGNFIENKGQWDDHVLFRISNERGFVEITKEGYRVMYGFDKKENINNNWVETSRETPSTASSPIPSHGYTELFYQFYVVEFAGMQGSKILIQKENEEPTRFNYYRGNDPKKWADGCKSFSDVWVRNIYPDVSVHYYVKDGKFKYDIVVETGGKVSDIKMVYKKIDRLEALGKTQLKIQTSANYYLYENLPVAYEEIANERYKLSCKYQIANNHLQFKLKSDTFHHRIIIDPEFVFSTFSGAKGNNLAYCSSFDRSGIFLSGGIVFRAGDFPITAGNTDYNPLNSDKYNPDITFFRLSADGKNNLAATVIGSNGNDEPKSIKESPDSGIIIIGRTTDANTFPSVQSFTGNVLGKGDIFVLKLDTLGRLIRSLVMGGSGDEVTVKPDVGADIVESQKNSQLAISGDLGSVSSAFDDNNNLVFVTSTHSKDFPIVGNAFQRSNPTGVDKLSGVIVKMRQDLSGIFYAGYIGGDDLTVPKDIAYDANTRRYHVVGATKSRSLPSAINTHELDGDGFVMTITEPALNAYSIVRSRFVGTSGWDVLYNVDIDKNSFVYFVGTTNSNNFPISNVNYSTQGAKHFIQKYDSSLNTLQFSTTFGPRNTTNPSLAVAAFLVDYCENLYVAGWGGTSFNPRAWKNADNSFPIKANNDPLRGTFDDNGDYYTIVLERDSRSLLYAGFLGATTAGTDEHFHFGENQFDDDGILYQTVCVCTSVSGGKIVSYPNYPIYPQNDNTLWSQGLGRNKYAPDFSPTSYPLSNLCNTSMSKIIFDYGGVKSTLLASSDGGKVFSKTVKGCLPIEVILADNSSKGNKGKTFYWTFGDDGTTRTTTTDTVHHIFQNRGVYQVQLISENLDLCITRDTSYIEVTILEGEIKLNFKPEILDCSGATLAYQFLNTSMSDIDLSNINFKWNMGDGSIIRTVGASTINYTYKTIGDYEVSLKLDDAFFCKVNNPRDSITATVPVGRIMAIGAGYPAQVCSNSPFRLVDRSVGAESITLDWGDGSPTETRTDIFDTVFTHSYTTAGNYTITMTGRIPSCDRTRVNTFNILVQEKPLVDFSFSPVVEAGSNMIAPNATVTFTNKGSNATIYDWNFGDEVAAPEDNISSIFSPTHLYATSGEKTVTLVGTSVGGCADTVRKKLVAQFIPILEIALAFSPNGDGVNDEIGVEGVAIKTIDWKIYDRKGNLIFQTSNPLEKWNGKDLNGVAVPIDTYIYSIEGYFYGNHVIKKSGEITVIK